ncbi:MAG: DUF1778 domain-containing protein [Pseudomonadota bacterium]
MAKQMEIEASITFRVSQEQRARIEDAARREDRTLSSFLRVAAMNRVQQVLDPPVRQCITDVPAQASGQA